MNRKRDLNSVYAWARAIAGSTSQQQQQQKKKKKKKKKKKNSTSKLREEEIKEDDEEEKAEADQCLPPRSKIQIEEVVEEKKNAESQVNPYAISDEQKTENERIEGRGIDDHEEEGQFLYPYYSYSKDLKNMFWYDLDNEEKKKRLHVLILTFSIHIESIFLDRLL